MLELHDGDVVGRAECVPYARYGESVAGVRQAIEEAAAGLSKGAGPSELASLRPGAARNALDCALWELRAKRAATPVWQLLDLARPPAAVSTMRTVSVGDPDEMRAAAAGLSGASLIKVKADGGPDLARIEAVHRAAPRAGLVIDANEAWSPDQLSAWLPRLPELGVVMLEQPLPAGDDSALEGIERAVPICADESFHDRGSFEDLGRRYDVVNLKLDKAGGLSEAIACVKEARRRGLGLMLGCMVSSSLAIEPALLLAEGVEYIDLDGPLLLEIDREGAAHDRDAGVLVPSSLIWGGA